MQTAHKKRGRENISYVSDVDGSGSHWGESWGFFLFLDGR
jgi:hypothetical protein